MTRRQWIIGSTLLIGCALAGSAPATLCVDTGTTVVMSTDPDLDLLLRLEEASGSRVDSSGKGNDMTPVNNPGRSSDYREGSFSLNLVRSGQQYLQRTGTSLSAGFPGNAGSANTHLTVAGWVKPKIVGGHPLVIKVAASDRSYTLWLWNFGAGMVIDPNIFNVAGQDYSGRGVADFHGNTVLAPNQWYHFAWTYDGTTGTSRVYLNGALDAGPFNENMTTYFGGSADLQVGFRAGVGLQWADALLDEVVVLDRALSDAEVAGLYQYGVVAPTVFCDDANACNGVETCNPMLGCQAGSPPNCEDGNPCTDNFCDPMSGCQTVNNTNPCNDNDACTTGEACSGGSCGGGSAVTCNDGNGCTTDTCVSPGGCVYTPNTNPCNDNDACTTGEACSGGSCGGGSAVTCNDGNGCTTDTCAPASGCVFTANSDPCDDGVICTNNDTCSGSMCTGTTAPRLTCREPSAPAKSILVLKNSTDDQRDFLLWKWGRGATTTIEEYGDPVMGSTGYTLCVYDQDGSGGALLASADIEPGAACGSPSCWKGTGSQLKYKDADGAQDGVQNIRLKSGAQGEAKILLKARGADVQMPAALSVAQNPGVIVELYRNDSNICWGATFSAPPAKSTSSIFKAKSD
jgi:hypothetical protein